MFGKRHCCNRDCRGPSLISDPCQGHGLCLQNRFDRFQNPRGMEPGLGRVNKPLESGLACAKMKDVNKRRGARAFQFFRAAPAVQHEAVRGRTPLPASATEALSWPCKLTCASATLVWDSCSHTWFLSLGGCFNIAGHFAERCWPAIRPLECVFGVETVGEPCVWFWSSGLGLPQTRLADSIVRLMTIGRKHPSSNLQPAWRPAKQELCRFVPTS